MVSECEHVWRTKSIKYGRYKRAGYGRYQEMEHRQVCRKCGKEQRIPDRYFGNDRMPGYVARFDSEGRQI